MIQTFFETMDYSTKIIIITILVSGVSNIFSIFILSKRHRKIIEVETRVFEQEKHLKETIIRAQNEKALETAQRIAGEFLHQKVINGRLAPHIRQLEEMNDLMYNNPQNHEALIDKIQTLKQEIQETRDLVRDISRHIFPPFLAHFFVESCQQLLEELQSQYPDNAQIVFDNKGGFRQIDLFVLYNLYNIIDLFVTNSLQHAHAQQIEISLHHYPEHIILKISDNGRGFNMTEINKTSRGIGVAEIQGKAHVLTPQYVFESEIGKGTRFELKMPLLPKK